MSTTNQEITPELSVKRLVGTFPGNLGIEMTEVTDEQVRGRMRIDKRHLHSMGYVNGRRVGGVRGHGCRLGANFVRTRVVL